MTTDNNQGNFIRDGSADRRYFTILPNILWTKGLSLTAFKLYATIKKVAGEKGVCYMSTRRLAAEADISVGAVSEAKRALHETGLISIICHKQSATGQPVDHIRITDIWEENVLCFKLCSPGEHKCSPSEHKCSPGEHKCSPGELEEEPGNKNPEEEQAAAAISQNAFGEVYQAYIDTFGSLMSPFQYERFKDLWDEYPEAEVHQVAREEMYKAMMRKTNPVAPNLNYYAKCLQTEVKRHWVVVNE